MYTSPKIKGANYNIFVSCYVSISVRWATFEKVDEVQLELHIKCYNNIN